MPHDSEIDLEVSDEDTHEDDEEMTTKVGAEKSSTTTSKKPEDSKSCKKKKRKKNDAKNWRFAETIGVEENDSYPKFKDNQRLLINMANCKYFVIRFVAKHLFNFKLSFK